MNFLIFLVIGQIYLAYYLSYHFLNGFVDEADEDKIKEDKNEKNPDWMT